MLPDPTLVTRAPAALEFEHMDQTQVAGATESGEICDSYNCAARSDKSLVHQGWQPLLAADMRPSLMRHDSATRNGSHVSLNESPFSAERCEIPYRSNASPVRIDEPVMCLDIVAVANAVHMRPALMRLKFPLALREATHRASCQAFTPAKIREVDDGDSNTVRVAESQPGSPDPEARAGCLRLNVVADATINASRTIDPELFGV